MKKYPFARLYGFPLYFSIDWWFPKFSTRCFHLKLQPIVLILQGAHHEVYQYKYK